MKKLFGFILLLGLFISCEGPMGPPGADGSGTWRIEDITVNNREWQYSSDSDGQNGHYFYSINFPDIDKFIYNNGKVFVSLEFEDSYGNFTQQDLPIVRHYEDNGKKWTRTIDFDYSKGNITFYVTDSEFKEGRPEEMLFRVVLLW